MEINDIANSTSGGASSDKAFSGSSSGFEEQWQRQLEKAYFEKQVDLMRQTHTGSEDDADRKYPSTSGFQPANIEITSNQLVSGNQIPGNKLEAPRVVGESTTNSATLVVPLVAQSGSAVDIGRAQPPLTIQPAQSKSVTQPQSQGKAQNVELIQSFRLVLPETSSVKIILSDKGIHLAVRDATMERDQVMALLKDIKELVRATHQRLAAITLNGALIWENSTPHLSEELALNAKSHESDAANQLNKIL